MICPSCDEVMDVELGRIGLGVHPTCPAIDSDVDIVVSEILETVRDSIVNQPRSLQVAIGPSEIGHPCDRRIGYTLAATPKVNDRGVAWKPYVGTAVHEQMATIMGTAEIERFTDEHASPRWHIEERVTVGTVNGRPITGSTDLFDGHHGIVFDWKFTSRNQIQRNYRVKGPGPQYRTQAHLYGRGWANAGHDVRHVAIIFLTRDGEFTDRYVWHEPYDEQVALDGLKRVDEIATALDSLGPEFTLPILPVVDSYCSNCPWFATNAASPAVACTGAPGTSARRTDVFADLIGT